MSRGPVVFVVGLFGLFVLVAQAYVVDPRCPKKCRNPIVDFTII